ncbi:hypothetical protein GCM10023322_52190 [Rugosimonospora acidiphila]|uniref:ATP-dependent DNA helicase RecQ n=1 Tax=Rugosimonospora acidiphila TaxID=556531 RepID=A0ABP9SAN6_9ACTN
MTAQRDLLQDCLRGDVAHQAHLTGPHRRLADAWLSDQPGPAISGDVAALLGHVLRHERGVTGPDSKTHLDLDLAGRGISVDSIQRANLDGVRFGTTHYRVSPGTRWAPTWLHGNPEWIDLACASPGPYVDSCATSVPTYARPTTPVAADPALTTIAPKLDSYRSRTQATAVRTAALRDPRSTLHVVLPTGTGKSLVGIAPGLFRSNSTTIVLVPTTALALDQERNIRCVFPVAALPTELAYYSDRAPAEKELILKRLKEGSQRLLFASPEALVGGLVGPLRELASSGGLTHFVIDEAHLVRTWGLSFRPEFQIVAALLTELRVIATSMSHEPPRVTLMTATLSAAGLELNDELFRGEQPSTFVGSTYLRTELRYLVGERTSTQERVVRLIEALHHLPRPAIIYTALVNDARNIARELREAGFARTEAFHGRTGSAERLEILRHWSGEGGPTTCDVVVGTSAFGLGVDQADVRTVIHACAPASVDRFYQEVGRAGRDGHAALSVWLPAEGDVERGRGIERTTVIGDDKAWNRWVAMRSHRAELEGGSMVLDTSIVPPHKRYRSDANRLWNRNTLVLMQRAELIAIEARTPPSLVRAPDESEELFRARCSAAWDEFARLIRVRIRPSVDNLDQQTFEQALASARNEIKASESASIRRVDRLLRREECWAKILREEYDYHDVGETRASQSVSPSCSGCPATGHVATDGLSAVLPMVVPVDVPDLGRGVRAPLERLAAGQRSIVVSYAGRDMTQALSNLVQRCVSHGVRAVLADSTIVRRLAVKNAYRYADEGLVMVDEIPLGGPPVTSSVPTLILLDHDDSPRVRWLSPTSGPLLIVVVPETMADPEYPNHLLKHIRSPHWSLSGFLRSI